MKGFFDISQGRSKSRPNVNKTYSCASCGLYKKAITHKIEPYGNFKKGILNIGEAPGFEEDKREKPWQGKVGRILKRAYRKVGIDLFDDCLNINAVNCRPSGNKTPTPHQIACCRNVMVEDVIQQYQPQVIVLLGSSALKSFLGHRWKSDLGGIDKWRGWTIPDQDYKSWVCPTYHPSFIARSEEEVEVIWLQDLERIAEMTDQKLIRFKKPNIEFVDDLSFLYDLKTDLTSLDFETTGLKPHREGHEIRTASVSPNPNKSYVFEIPKERKKLKPFLDYLDNHKIGKMAHNMKFELAWAEQILGQTIKGINFDSMLAAHILDNRPGVAGLKFQTYVRLGIVDYASEVEPFLRAGNKESGGNDFNSVNKLMNTPEGRKKLMLYNGYDTAYEYRIALQMINEIDYDFLPMFDL